jgi:electron transport complex protein RnfD
MRQVIYALGLGTITLFYFFGFTVLWQLILGILSALCAEALFLKLRQKPIKPALQDGSAILSGALLALSIPTIAPWWLVVVGVFFAIIFGKQLYGGLGNNPFNPAMLGYAFLLISYPLQMTQWQVEFLDFFSSFEVIFGGHTWDALTGATRLENHEITNNSSFWVNLAFLLGGIYLIFRRMIFWHIPLSLLFGAGLMAFLLGENIFFHLSTGSIMLGAFFIATDPVSAATTPKGRLIYGFMIGVLLIIIRVSGNYPDGMAFAVLLLNITVPLIDYYTRPKVFGQ